MTSQGKIVASDIDVAGAMRFVGTHYPSPNHTFAELADNGRDAGAKVLYILLEPTRYVVYDNGHGMVPWIPPEDREILELYRQGDENFDVRTVLNELALKSVEWMVTNIALSSKLQVVGSKSRGVFGIGFQSWRQIANNVVLRTRPNKDLARAYYGEDVRRIPTIILYPPTNDKLFSHDSDRLNNRIIDDSYEPLLDPFGQVLESGTVIEMTEIREGLDLRPSALAQTLKSRFGEDIRRRTLSITIIDRISEESRKFSGGLRILVEPVKYEGSLILQKTGYLPNGESPFVSEIYYKPGAKGLRPKIRRLGGDVGPITSVADTHPFNSGLLDGYIETPEVSDSRLQWNSDKTMPMPGTPAYNQWLKFVNRLAEELNEKLQEIHEKERQESHDKATLKVQETFVQAMSRNPIYKGLTAVSKPRADRSKGKRKKKTTRIPEARTFASVINEHNDPVAGVALLLVRSKTLLDQRITGISGTVTFGKLEPGRYTVKIGQFPEGMEVLEETFQHGFEISINQPRVHVYFRLKTGQAPKPKRNKTPGLVLWPHDLQDPGVPYSYERLKEYGLLELNTEYSPYERVRNLQDTEGQMRIEALIVASALAEYTFPKENPAFLFSQMIELYEEAYPTLFEED